MGLLSRINDKFPDKPRGLLAKAECAGRIHSGTDISFHVWAEKKGFDLCALLKEENNCFHFTHIHGLSLKSLETSYSTKDFWNGLIDGKNWNCFSGEKVLSLLQIFSSEDRKKISTLYVLPFTAENENFLFVVSGDIPLSTLESNKDILRELRDFSCTCNGFEQSVSPEAVKKALTFCHASFFVISARLALDKLFCESYSDEKQKLCKMAMKEIHYALSSMFPHPNSICRGNNCELKAVLFLKDDIDANLLQFHLNKMVSHLFENSSENLQVLPAGQCSSEKGINDFLLKG